MAAAAKSSLMATFLITMLVISPSLMPASDAARLSYPGLYLYAAVFF